MNKKLFLAMSRRRVSCPLTAQQLWDAVKIIRYKRQVPDIKRITRYMNRTHNVFDDEVGRQINYCVRDGLLKVIKKVGSKGSKIGVEQEGYKLPDDKLEKDGHDWYCFECHIGGDVICCTSCHRVYHLSCMSKDDLPEDDVKNKFTCIVCKRQANKELTPNIKKSQLNRLLKYTATKMKDRLPVALTDRQPPSNTSYLSERFAIQGQVKSPSIDVPSNFKWVLNDKEEWRVDYLIYRPIDLHVMEAKANSGTYEHLEEFRADIQTIVHNVVIYHGVHSHMADMARLMLRDCNTDLQEILECWLCYKHQNDKTLRNWFIKPCKPPHELVYARQKGYPYWPAKVIKENDDSYDVRFFGGVHERATVEKLYIRPISVNIHTLQVKRTSSWNRACEELKRYQKQFEKLREETNNFTLPFVDSSSDESDNETTLKKQKSSKEKTVMMEDEDDEEDLIPLKNRIFDKDIKNEDKRARLDVEEKETKSKTPTKKTTNTNANKTESNVGVVDGKKVGRGRGRPRKMETKTLMPLKEETEATEQTVDKERRRKPVPAVTPIATISLKRIKTNKGRGRPSKMFSSSSSTSSHSSSSSFSSVSSKVPVIPMVKSTKNAAKKVRNWSSSVGTPGDNGTEDLATSMSAAIATDTLAATTSTTMTTVSTVATVSAVTTNTTASTSTSTTATTMTAATVTVESKPNGRSEEAIEPHNVNDLVDNDITSTSGNRHSLSKGNEEEIVSSSSSLAQNLSKKSVKTQTKPFDMKPSKEWIEKIEEEFEREKERVISKLNKEHEQEMAMLRQAHTAILSETKRKQWCVNCESEAIYHCCWNTSYCSPDCQLTHWAADHKRHCRRKR